MTIFFSKTTNAFYDSAVHGTNVPADVVEITPDHHQMLLETQGNGKVISADANGFPILADRAPPTTAEANASIVQQIATIERDQQPRAMRDMLLYNDNTRLKALDAQIADLRTQLK